MFKLIFQSAPIEFENQLEHASPGAWVFVYFCAFLKNYKSVSKIIIINVLTTFIPFVYARHIIGMSRVNTVGISAIISGYACFWGKVRSYIFGKM